MEKKTIAIDSNVGQRLESMHSSSGTHLVYMGKGISIIDKITLGRDDSNSISLEGNLISRFHAEIQRIGNDYFLKDLNSLNGTYVNDCLVPKNKYIKLGNNDIIRIGNHEINLVRYLPKVIKKSLSGTM